MLDSAICIVAPIPVCYAVGMQSWRFPAVWVCIAAVGCGSGSGATAQTQSDAGTPEVDAADDTDSSTPPVDAPEEASPDVVEELATADAPMGAGSLEKRSYAGPEGTRDYLLYLPAGHDSTPLPLVVALHGCDESAAHFAYVSQLNWLADTERFIVAWPEQTAVANTLLCWNWFLTAHQQRNTGEAAIIAGITRSVAQEFPVLPDRIHAVGISAGGAMALVEGVVFPDLYASVATVAGCPFQGTPCVGSPTSLSGDALASLAFQAMGAHARALPVFVMQGDADFNVTPPNGELIVQQFLGVADRADDGASNDSVSRQPAQSSSGSVPGGHDYDIDVYEDAEAHPILERWLVHGMGHAWSGGAAAITYSDPAGPDASFESYRFFKQHPMP